MGGIGAVGLPHKQYDAPPLSDLERSWHFFRRHDVHRHNPSIFGELRPKVLRPRCL